MRFDHQSHFLAPPDQVHAMLVDPAFREKVCADIGSVAYRATAEPEGSGGVRVTVDHTQRVRHVPAFAARLIGEAIQIVQVEHWTSDTGATFDVTIPGKPGTISGDIMLVPDGTGTVETVTGEVTVRLPLVGGRLEALVAEQLTAALRAERETGQRWLAGER